MTTEMMFMTDAAQEMIEKIVALDEACGCNDPDEVAKYQLPIRQLTQDELTNTLFCETPCHVSNYEFPYLKPDGTPLGGFGKQHLKVEVFQDGTAIGRLRCWKYDYRYDHEHKGCIDGKPVKSPGPMQNKMTVRFYLIGCKHEYQEQNHRASEFGLTLFRCDHLNICKHCGHRNVTNSSD